MLGAEPFDLYRITIADRYPEEHYLLLANSLSEAIKILEEKHPEVKLGIYGSHYSAKAFFYGEIVKVKGVIDE